MEIHLKIYDAGQCIETKQYDFFPGPPEPRVIHLDITKYVRRVLLEAARLTDTTHPRKKEPKPDGSHR